MTALVHVWAALALVLFHQEELIHAVMHKVLDVTFVCTWKVLPLLTHILILLIVTVCPPPPKQQARSVSCE